MSKRNLAKGMWKKAVICLCVGVLLAGMAPLESQAATKISSLKIKFSTEETDEYGAPVIEAESDSEKYSVGDVMTMEEYASEWSNWDYGSIEDIYNADYDSVFDDDDDDDDDRKIDTDLLAWNRTYRAIGDLSELTYVVEAEASDGYYFTNTKDKFRLSGLGAEILKLERLEKKTILVLYVRFSELDDVVSRVETAAWTEDGIAQWEAIGGAAFYELRLVCNGKRSASKETGAAEYDFRPLMKKSGTYQYEIRAISATGAKGEWAESASLIVSEEMAEYNQNRFGVEAVPQGDGDGPPESYAYRNIGWKQMEDGRYWYQEADGSYPQQNWLWYDGNWYFFDKNGFMMKETYVKWGNEAYYLDAAGHMITEGRSPDGRLAAVDGRLSWPVS